MRLSSIAAALVVAAVATAGTPARAQGTNASGNLIIKDLHLTGLSFDPLTGILTATGGTVSGTLAGAPFTTEIENFVLQLLPAGPQAGCAILDLDLAPIHISLLGLHVDTSAICLDITAIPGGGLLGDLLCGIANGTLPLDLLDSAALLGGLTEILTQALHQGQRSSGNSSVCTGQCAILDLVLGPLDLTLLGLNVHLDNCANGPVEVCVSATASEGLLGNLLCSLTGQQLLGITLKDIAMLVKRLAG